MLPSRLLQTQLLHHLILLKLVPCAAAVLLSEVLVLPEPKPKPSKRKRKPALNNKARVITDTEVL